MQLFLAAGFLTLTGFCAGQLQTLSEIPDCAKPCAATLPSQCNLGVSCICSDESFISGISCCIKKACSAADQAKTLMLAQQLCDTVQVKLPSGATCPSSAAAAGASSAAGGASAATSAISSGTATMTSTMSSASGSAMSAAIMAGSTTGVATGTSATGSPTSTVASTTSEPTTAATGAAQVIGLDMGAIGAAVAALALM